MQSYNNVLLNYDISAARFARAVPQQGVSAFSGGFPGLKRSNFERRQPPVR
jgi:hypothetical protein